ncbi:MAG: hypothetical protein Q8Q12_11385 [bacterium]|nr:hypothetical protein [bacterium]
MAKPTNGEDNNGESENAASGQGKPEQTPPEGGLSEVSKTVQDATLARGDFCIEDWW